MRLPTLPFPHAVTAQPHTAAGQARIAMRARPARACAALALLCLASGHAAAQEARPPGATPMSFQQAQLQLHSHSDQLAASRAAVESARLRREGMARLGGPSVSLGGAGYAYSFHADLNLGPVRQAVTDAVAQLPSELVPPAAGGEIATAIPNTYQLHHSNQSASASVSAVWPVYVGGLANAVRAGLDAATDEALADASTTHQSLQAQLAERYFDAQLAARAAALRERALEAVQQHDAAAQSMLEAGVIAQVERLQAQAALADAQQQAHQARNTAQLAQAALARALRSDTPVAPTTPLFVHSEPLPPLRHFIELAQLHHPGLDKVQAKKRQAESLHAAQQALRRPQVLAFGSHELNTSGRPNWVAGVAVRWTLWDSIDRDSLERASLQSVTQAERTYLQAREDIALLVEKHWLDVEHARTQYLHQQTQQELADEMLRLRRAGLREGTSTTLDLIDAELNLAKIQTERAQSANQYVKALAGLLESTGQSDAFLHYQARADIQLGADTP